MGKRMLAGIVGAWLLACVMPARTPGAEAAKPKPDAAAPWSDMKALDLRMPFDTIRYPHLDKDGNVTFIADDEFYSGDKAVNHGIYRYQAADGSLVCLVRAGETTIPGRPTTLRTFMSLQMDENGVDFSFNAADADADKGHGLYHWSNGKLEMIAHTGETILPGDEEAITEVEYGTLHGTHLLYKATSDRLGPALVLHDLASGRNRVLCHGGMAIPGRSDDAFRFIASTNWISANSVVFCGASVTNPMGNDGKNTEGVYGWFGVKDWSDASPDLAPEKLRTVADGTTPMPGGDESSDDTFNLFGSAPVSGNHVAFEASGGQLDGIFAATVPDGPVRCIVNNQTEFDEPFKGRFTAFGGYPTMVGQNLVFTAVAQADDAGNQRAGGYRGVFVYRLDRGELFTLLDSRQPLDGGQIASFEIGSRVMVDDRFVATVHFRDKSNRIYLGTIKPEAFKQLNGGATPEKKPGSAP